MKRIKEFVETAFGIPPDLLRDIHYRTRISLYVGFFMNLIYIVIKMASGIYYRSVWFISVAVYYILLAVIRFLLFRHEGNTAGDNRLKIEYRRYRICGIMLLVMNQALMVIVMFMVHQNRGYEYPGYLIYAMAVYTFYAVTISIVNLVKSRRYESPVLSASNVVNLTAALVSMLSLETSMLAQFGNGDAYFRLAMTATFGGFICIAVFVMAVVMISKSTKYIKRLKQEGV